MAWPQHTRVQVGGTYENAGKVIEIWSWSLSVIEGPSGGAGLDATHRASVVSAVKAFHADPQMCISTSSHLKTIKVNSVGPDNRYTDSVANTDLEDVTGMGGGALAWPLQCCVVVSLDTGLRGPAHRGRFYLPPMGVNAATDATGRLSDATRDGIAAGAQNFLTALKAAGVTPIVASRTGSFPAVTSVRVGNVVDTLRSRRNAFQEAYKALPV